MKSERMKLEGNTGFSVPDEVWTLGTAPDKAPTPGGDLRQRGKVLLGHKCPLRLVAISVCFNPLFYVFPLNNTFPLHFHSLSACAVVSEIAKLTNLFSRVVI